MIVWSKLSRFVADAVTGGSGISSDGSSVEDGQRRPSRSTLGPSSRTSRASQAEDVAHPPSRARTMSAAAASRTKAPQKFEAIAVMGPTGSGKSTFISKLAPGQVVIGHDLNSCTEEVQDIRCKIHGKDLVLIDTPGFNDTDQKNRSDTVILESLMKFMKQSWENNMLLSGIIYLHPLTDARMTGSSITNLSMFRRLCGKEHLKNVILATTKWDDVKPEDAKRRQDTLESPDSFWGPYIAGGSKVRKFLNTEESAIEIVDEILSLGRFVPKIQEEAVKGTRVKDTDAGQYLNQALEELREVHEKETAALRAEIDLAKSQHNKNLEEALQMQARRLDLKVASTVEEQRKLNETEVEKLTNRIDGLEKKASVKDRLNELRFWHLRWRCLQCEEGKTDFKGEWECALCGYEQNNVY